MTKRTGNIDSRRITVDGIPAWNEVPALLVPGNMQAYGIYEDFLEEQNLAGADPIGRSPRGWHARMSNADWAMADVAGGVCMITTDGGDNDYGQITLGGELSGAFFPAANTEIWFETRIRQTIAGINTLNLAFGLIDPTNDEYLRDNGAGILAAIENYIIFQTLDTGGGNNAWSFVGEKATAADTNALTIDLVSLEWHTYGFYVHGVDNIYVYYDREYQEDGLIATANIPITGLMPFVAIKDGGDVEYVQIDYIMCIQTRV